jgi:hypothetical protein
MITARKAARSVRAMLPAWMLAAFAVCMVIPGPFDEAAMAVAVLVLGIAQPVRFRRAASAWRGGKTRRVRGDGLMAGCPMQAVTMMVG